MDTFLSFKIFVTLAIFLVCTLCAGIWTFDKPKVNKIFQILFCVFLGLMIINLLVFIWI